MAEFKTAVTTVNPQTTAIIVNSNPLTIDVSDAVANYYITVRGLNPAYKIYMDLGTNMSTQPVPTLSYALGLRLLALKNLNGLSCVVMSAKTPPLYAYLVGAYAGAVPFCTPSQGIFKFYLGYRAQPVNVPSPGLIFPEQSTLGAQQPNSLVGYSTYGPYVATNPATLENNAVGFDSSFPYRLLTDPNNIVVPAGRIGTYYRDVDLFAGETFAESKRIIDDAIANEGAALHVGKQALFGLGDRLGSLSGPYGYYRMHARGSQKAREWADRVGMLTLETYGSTLSIDVAPHALPRLTGSRNVDFNSLVAGTAPRMNLFMWNGCALTNPWPTPGTPLQAAYTNCFDVLPGALAHESTSYGYMVGLDFQRKGGCTWFGTIEEPGAGNTVSMEALQLYLSIGLTCAEAVLLAGVGSTISITCGDPLYRPFKNSPLTMEYAI